MIRGTSHDQDARFKDKAKKMLLESNWPDKYDTKIDLTKIDFQILREWIEKRTAQLLGEQDDIVSGTIISLLEESLRKEQKPNAKKIHVDMSGFMTNHTLTFISQLWDWLDEAQKSKSGIPKSMVDKKKEEERQKRQRLKEMGDKREKIKNYKFDVIKKHVGRERQPSSEVKRRQRRERSRSYERSSRKQRKYRQRSYSRDRNRRRRSEQRYQDRYDNSRRRKDEGKKKKRKRQYSRSRSNSSDGSENKNKDISREHSRSESDKKNHKKHNKQIRPEQKPKYSRKSYSRSESSSVVSSSSEQ